MRTEAPPATARAAETQPRRPQHPGRAPATPADLFANLLQAAEPGPAATEAAAHKPDEADAKQPKPGLEQAPQHATPGPDKPLPPPTDAAAGALPLPAATSPLSAQQPLFAAQQQGLPGLPSLPGLPAPTGTQTAASTDTLAGAAEAGAAEAGTSPAQAPGQTATRHNPGAFVSTVAKAQGKAAAMQAPPKMLADLVQNLVQSSRAALAPGSNPAAPNPAAQAHAWHMLAPGQPASALQEALGLGEEAGLGSGGLSLSTLERAGAGQRDPSGQGRDGGRSAPGAPLDASSASSASSETSAAASEFSQQLGEALQPGLEAAYEAINTQISLWAAGQTKKATLLLQDGLRQTLEIELRLDGEQARIDFLTDDPQLREAIQAQAQELLGELLERAGMELAGLSVGARSSDQSQGFARSQPEAPQRPREAAQASPEPQPPQLQLQARLPSGSSGLSVYA